MTDSQPPMWISLQLKGEDAGSPCPDCGQATQRVWGHVLDQQQTIAAYFVTWVPGARSHAIGYDMIFGRWDEEATGDNRVLVSLDHRVGDNAHAPKFVDAAGRVAHDPRLFSEALTWQAAMQSARAKDLLILADMIYRNDPRLEDVRKWGHE